METLIEAKEYINEHKDKGVKCPCCTQMYKVWRKRPISTAVASMCKLFQMQQTTDKYFHLDDFSVLPKDRNFSQLINWDLVEPMRNNDKDKRASGYWRLTTTGRGFVAGAFRIQKYVFTLNNKVVGYSEEKATVEECLGKKFSYAELMNDNFNS